MKLKKTTLLFGAGISIVLLLTFGKLLWVQYYAAQRSAENKPFYDIVIETIPFFLVALIIGVVIGLIRSKNK